MIKDAEVKRDELYRVADIAFNEAAYEILHSITDDNKAILGYLQVTSEQLLPAVKALQGDQLKAKEIREREEINTEFGDQIKWLKLGGPAELELPHKVVADNIKKRHPGTCKWIFDDYWFGTWLEPGSGSAQKRLLWLAGAAGFGKSILMSSIVDWLSHREVADAHDRPLILHFFCKTGNDETQKGSRIMIHLLLQLLTYAETKDPNRKSEEKAFYERKKRCTELVKAGRTDTKEKTQMSVQEFQTQSVLTPLLLEVARTFSGRRLYIVLDGLDECVDRQEGFTESLIQMAEADFDVRVVVSSRDESDIRDSMRVYEPWYIDVTKASTSKDVETYIEGSLKKIKRFRPSQKVAAVAKIAEKADGMFRCRRSLSEPCRRTKQLTWLSRCEPGRRELESAGGTQRTVQEAHGGIPGPNVGALRTGAAGSGQRCSKNAPNCSSLGYLRRRAHLVYARG